MVDGARRGLHRTHYRSHMPATQTACMGIHLRHNTLPRRLPAAKRRGFKAHRRHGSAGLFNLVRHHRRPACIYKRTRAGVTGHVNHCRRGEHRGQHNVAATQNKT